MSSTQDGFISPVLEPSDSGPAFPRLYEFVGENVAPIAPALYLRLLRLDLGSIEEILQFLSQNGPMYGTVWSEFIPMEWVDSRFAQAHLPTRFIEREIEQKFPHLADLRVRVEERSEGEDEPFFHREEFAIRARALRDATRVHLAASGTRTWKWAKENWESNDLFTAPGNADEAIRTYVLPLLNTGLSRLHPRIVTEETQDPYEYTLYAVLSLQLAHAIRDGQDYTDCPQCGEVFSKSARAYEDYANRVNAIPDLFEDSDVRKRAADVLYCSRRCANAASSRMYRQRLKAQLGTSSTP